MRTNEIVVGVDGSVPSGAALQWAAAEAVRHGRALRVVHGYEWPWRNGPLAPHPGGEVNERAETLVAEAMDEAHKLAPEAVVTGAAVNGDPASVLIDQARRATLLVVGHRGRGGFASLLLGSVALKLATHAGGPVAVVRAGPAAPDGPVVLGVSSAGADADALRLAFAEAAAHGCPLRAVHAWRPPTIPRRDGPGSHAEDVAERQTAERRWLGDAIGPWHADHPEVRVDYGLPVAGAAHALVEASRQARLLVVGSQGAGPVAGLLLGSVSQQVLHHAHCPVLVARPYHD